MACKIVTPDRFELPLSGPKPLVLPLDDGVICRISLNLQGLIRTLLSFHTKINRLGILNDFFVVLTGLEPVTLRVSGECSNQLSYKTIVGMTRLERATLWSQTRCATNCATSRLFRRTSIIYLLKPTVSKIKSPVERPGF